MRKRNRARYVNSLKGTPERQVCCCYLLQDPAAISESQMLKWKGTWDGTSTASNTPHLSSSSPVSPTAAAAAGGSGRAATLAALAAGRGSSSSVLPGLHGLAGSRHLAEVAPLSGLQPPPPRSRLAQNTQCTPGEMLYLRWVRRGLCSEVYGE